MSVPSVHLGYKQHDFAMLDRPVLGLEGRSVWLDGQSGPVKVSTKLVSPQIALRLVRFGDIATEPNLLDPITKALDHHFKLLLPPGAHRTWWVRSLDALAAFLAQDSTATHVVLVGHSPKGTGTLALPGRLLPAADLASAFGPSARLYLSLVCYSGRKDFAGHFTGANDRRQFVAPFQFLHGAVAVEAATLLFNNLLLRGDSPKVAVRHVNDSLPAGVDLRFWQSGSWK
ncbi:MAG TPA: hypothetical protein VL068_03860 [Microthrixaceae bacterium]|nr:hypothetical protein [Microthrixaceae bacterium]